MKLAIFSVLSFLRPQRYPQSPSLSHRERVALLVPGWSHRRYRRTGPLRSESSRRMPKKCNSWMTSESCCQAGALAHSPARQSPPYRRGRRCLRAVSYSPRTQTACGKRASARCRQEPIAYAFQVDGVRVLDPVNTHTSESNTLVWSMLSVSGSPLMDTRDVPHGAVASVFYYSQVLKTTRRMHIYIPPGYEERIRTEKGDSS